LTFSAVIGATPMYCRSRNTCAPGTSAAIRSVPSSGDAAAGVGAEVGSPVVRRGVRGALVRGAAGAADVAGSDGAVGGGVSRLGGGDGPGPAFEIAGRRGRIR
jgi:hypothetical protein